MHRPIGRPKGRPSSTGYGAVPLSRRRPQAGEDSAAPVGGLPRNRPRLESYVAIAHPSPFLKSAREGFRRGSAVSSGAVREPAERPGTQQEGRRFPGKETARPGEAKGTPGEGKGTPGEAKSVHGSRFFNGLHQMWRVSALCARPCHATTPAGPNGAGPKTNHGLPQLASGPDPPRRASIAPTRAAAWTERNKRWPPREVLGTYKECKRKCQYISSRAPLERHRAWLQRRRRGPV